MDKQTEITLYKKMYHTRNFQRKLDYSVFCVKKMLEICERPFVYFSYGKDSVVMSHIIRQIIPDIPHIFTYHDETAFLLNKEAVDISNINLKEVRVSNTSRDKDGNLLDCHDRERTTDIVEAVAPYNGYFKGIRAEEATYRRIAVFKARKNNLIHKYKRDEKGRKAFRKHEQNIEYSSFPIGLFTLQDIWTYIYYHNLSVPYQYKYAPRTTAGFTGLGIDDTLYALREEDPEAYKKCISLYPELG